MSAPGTAVDGATVLLTGASRGLGRELAHEFARRGARLALVARNPSGLRDVEHATGGVAFAHDLAETTGLEALVNRVEDRCGPIDIVVNNAALSRLAPIEEYTAEELTALFAVNLTAPAELTRVLIPRMRRRGVGHIVNIASLGGVISIPGQAPYGASKAGLAHLTAVLEDELRDSPLRLTLAQLGAIEGTGMYDEVMRSPTVGRIVRRAGRLGVGMALPAPVVAQKIVEAVQRGQRVAVIPRLATGLQLMRQSPIAVARVLGSSRRGVNRDG